MKFRGGEFSTGTTGNFQSELTLIQRFMCLQEVIVLSQVLPATNRIRRRVEKAKFLKMSTLLVVVRGDGEESPQGLSSQRDGKVKVVVLASKQERDGYFKSFRQLYK